MVLVQVETGLDWFPAAVAPAASTPSGEGDSDTEDLSLIALKPERKGDFSKLVVCEKSAFISHTEAFLGMQVTPNNPRKVISYGIK